MQKAVRYLETLELADTLAAEVAKPVVHLTTVRALVGAIREAATENALAMRAIAGLAESYDVSRATIRWAREIAAQRAYLHHEDDVA